MYLKAFFEQGKQGRIFNNIFEGELLLQAQQVDFYMNAVPSHRKRVIIIFPVNGKNGWVQDCIKSNKLFC
jgi:hypothetical protein